MKLRRGRASVVAAALATLTALAGCSGSSTDNGAVETSATPTQPTNEAIETSMPPTSLEPPPSDATAPETTAVSTTFAAATTTTLVADLDGVDVTLTDIGEYDEPIAMTHRPGDAVTMYLAERGGGVRAISDEDDIEILDISAETEGGGEQGLLGLAASPDGQFLYVSSTRVDGTSAIDAYAFAADGTLDAGSRRTVIEIEQPYGNHNGGHLAFGPDGYLYLGMGDGGSGDDPERRSLNPNELLGKMLRIDPATPAGDLGYSVPSDNPFVDDDTFRPEIWSTGLRNPWRYSFDRVTGDLWIGDVGQGEWEEIDLAPAATGTGRGVSFGWSAFEGTHRFNDDQAENGHQLPIHEYSHSSGDGNSVTGGFVYRGSAIPELSGAYVFGDYETGNIWAITASADGTLDQGPVKIAERKALASFGEGPDGELYVLSLEGKVSRIDPG